MTEPEFPKPEPADAERPAPQRPGTRTFTLEGRSAPGLFLVGWLAFLMGAGCLGVAFVANVGAGVTFALALVGLALLSLGLVAGAGSQAIERRVAAADGAPESPRGPSPFLVFAAAIPLSLFIVALVGIPLVALGMDTTGPLATLIAVAIQALVYLGLVRLLVVGTDALSWREMGIGGRPRAALIEDVASGMLIAVPILVVTAVLAALLSRFLPMPDSPLPPSGGTGGLLANVLAAVVVAPLGEELFFRAFATTAWARSMPIRSAVIRGAVFFAIGHVLTVGGADFGDAAGRALVAFVTRLPVALALGAIFMRRRSLAAPLALHATFNALLIVIAQVAANG